MTATCFSSDYYKKELLLDEPDRKRPQGCVLLSSLDRATLSLA
jgi:hypothetical protein